MKMKWVLQWLPNDDQKTGKGWLSAELLYPSPEYKGRTDGDSSC